VGNQVDAERERDARLLADACRGRDRAQGVVIDGLDLQVAVDRELRLPRTAEDGRLGRAVDLVEPERRAEAGPAAEAEAAADRQNARIVGGLDARVAPDGGSDTV